MHTTLAPHSFRNATKIGGFAFMLLAGVGAGAQATTLDSLCVRDFQVITAVVRDDYAGYRAKAAGAKAARLRILEDSVRGALDQTSADACTSVLRSWLSAAFHDGHLSVADVRPSAATQPVARDNHPSVSVLDDHTAIVRVPSFGAGWKAAIDSVLHVHWKLLTAMPYLIIDVRGNSGGGASSYEGLLRLVYTDSLLLDDFETLASPGNIAGIRALMSLAGFPDDIKREMARLLAAMETNPGEFVRLSTQHRRGFDSVYARPRRVGVIIDRRCVSACELFVVDAKTSRKVTVYGVTPTGGVVDYGNVRPILLPSGERRLNLPMARSRRLPTMPLDNRGIEPDVPLLSTDTDPIIRIRGHLRGSQPRRLY